MVQNILDKINVEALTEEERVFVTKTLQKAHEQKVKKDQVKAEKMIQNEEILNKIDEMLESQAHITATQVYEELGGGKKYSIQKVSYVIRELSDLVAIDNPLYAVKVYTRK